MAGCINYFRCWISLATAVLSAALLKARWQEFSLNSDGQIKCSADGDIIQSEIITSDGGHAV